MSAQQDGYAYLTSYSGLLKIGEEILNITIICFLAICGNELKTYFLNGVAICALICTGLFLVLYIAAVIKRTGLPWFWIECVYALLMGLLYMLAASITLSILIRSYVITGIVGYVVGLIYMIDTVDKYSLAVTPRAKYVWNVPNMPEGE